MYFMRKQSVEYHGILWIGTDLDLAIQRANKFASNEGDDYYSFIIYAYKEPIEDLDEPLHTEVYRAGNPNN